MPMTLIQRQTLSGTQASVTFSNIPQNYQTLKLVISSRCDDGGSIRSLYARINTSASTYTDRYVTGTGAAASSSNGASTTYAFWGDVPGGGNTASTFGNMEITFPNYTGSTNKPMSSDSVTENNGTTAYQRLVSTLWSTTSSISSLNILPDIGSFVSGSTFSLYGIS